MKKTMLGMLVHILLILGGLNYGLMAVANIDAIAKVFGVDSVAAQVVYGLIGLSALFVIFKMATCKGCHK